MNTNEQHFEYPAEPDFNGWEEAVEVLVMTFEPDYYPSEATVAQAVEAMEEVYDRKLDPKNADDLDIVVAQLFTIFQ